MLSPPEGEEEGQGMARPGSAADEGTEGRGIAEEVEEEEDVGGRKAEGLRIKI